MCRVRRLWGKGHNIFGILSTPVATSRQFLFMVPLFFQVVLLESASRAGNRRSRWTNGVKEQFSFRPAGWDGSTIKLIA